MKYIFFFCLFSLASCVSTKYNVAENNADFGGIQAGTRYTFFTFDEHKQIMDVTAVKKDSIIGQKKEEQFSIAKKDIKKIRKNNTGATVILAGSTVGGVALITAGLLSAIKVSDPE